MNYHNPYSGADFFSFFAILAKRLFSFDLPLATDEVQLLTLLGVALSSALVGGFLVLRKMSMLANALSHTILVGIILAFLLTRSLVGLVEGDYGVNMGAMLIASVATGLCTAFLTQFCHKTLLLQEDASIGLVFTTLFAVGIILTTLFTKNAHVGLEVVMGNVDALQPQDLELVWTISAINVLMTLFFFKEYSITTFDGSFAKGIGISPRIFNYLLMIQTSLTVIGAFRAVGVLMVLAFLVGPTLIARMLTHNLTKLFCFAIGVGALTALIGVALARHLLSVHKIALSTGGLIVCLLGVFYLLTIIFSSVRSRHLI